MSRRASNNFLSIKFGKAVLLAARVVKAQLT
jgi:hypothetical protein